jgi:hypothetical protein
MNPVSDTTATGNDGSFDPQQAAALLDQTTQQARRTFGPAHPALWTFRAVGVLVVFGGLWLSARSHQNPYSAPNGWALGITFAFVAINIIWSVAVLQRAGAGVSGPVQRRKRTWIGLMFAAWIAAYAFTAPLYHATAGHPAWGLYPASAPLLFIGLLGAVSAAAVRDWRMAGITLGIAIIAAAAGFGGPAGAWLIMGIGLSALMLGAAGFAVWQQRRSVVQP